MSTLFNERPVVDVATLQVIEGGINKKRLELLETKKDFAKYAIEILVDAADQLVVEEARCDVHCPEMPGENSFAAYEVLPGVFYSVELSYRGSDKGTLYIADDEASANDPLSDDLRVWVLPVITTTPDRIQHVINRLYVVHFPGEEIPQFHRRR